MRSAGTPRRTSSSRIVSAMVMTASAASITRSSWARRRWCGSPVSAMPGMDVQVNSKNERTSYTNGRAMWVATASPTSAASKPLWPDPAWTMAGRSWRAIRAASHDQVSSRASTGTSR